jgi:tetratricopeptide (TPR) repeat protein
MKLSQPWLLILFSSLLGCVTPESEVEVLPPPQEEARYVGSAACGDCHEEQWAAWSESHHHRAIQLATQDTVLGDFHGEAVTPGHSERPVVDAAGAFSVHSKGSAGAPVSYPVRYTFGHTPLQQYLLDVGGGRLQAWSWAWDTRPASSGGQRWFSLHGDTEPTSDDPLHWSGRGFNWNSMCADCHSTGIRKNYALETDSYDTSFSELAVGCEACHGPASRHLDWTENPSANAKDRGLLGLRDQRSQINACAACHSRRSQLAEGFRPDEPFLDYYAPELLHEGLYHVDGQINEEVYVYGSFLQSRMHRQGVTCTHCHEPHRAAVRLTGNALCTQCHSPAGSQEFPTLQPGLYDDPAHTFHPAGSSGAQCIGCHMPEKTYMGVDPRRDHGFRLPRPDLSRSLGVPDPCLSCHTERSSVWSQAEIERHHGEARPPHFATALDQGRKGLGAAEPELARLARDLEQPVMVRATAASLLGTYGGAASTQALAALVGDPEPLVRLGAADGMGGLPPAERWRLGAHLLSDDHLAIRLRAFEVLLEISRPGEQTPLAFRRVMSEYLETQALQAEHPESHTNLGLLYTSLGDLDAAQGAYDQALARQADWIPALINSAELARARGDASRERQLLQAALTAAPDSAEVHYAKALWLTRAHQPREAVQEYAKARDLEPDTARYWYALGLSQLGAGNTPAAMHELEEAVARWPAMLELRLALVSEYTKAENLPSALRHAQALVEISPGDPHHGALLEKLKAQAAGKN